MSDKSETIDNPAMSGSELLRPSCSANSKSCFNCKHLEWVEAEEWDPMGYVCNKRKYRSEYEENTHMAQMEDKKYLLKAKKCCELKQQNPEFTDGERKGT